MIVPGLVSVSFRKLSVSEVIELVVKSGTKAIEWGGDVHVPHGDIKTACEVCKMMTDAGLVTASYGSYYILGKSEDDGLRFEKVLESAIALGADTIRIWPGNVGSDKADKEYRVKVADESRRIAEMAAGENMLIAYELHPNTLTDTTDSALDLLEAVGHENMKTYWQMNGEAEMEYAADSIKRLAKWITNIHVSNSINRVRHPLSEFEDKWKDYFAQIEAACGNDKRYAMIEFVTDDEPANFLMDANKLRGILQG